MDYINLFNELQPGPDPVKPKRSVIREFKSAVRFRIAESKDRSCKYCINKITTCTGSNKYFYKCRFIGITSGPATDIRLKNVCDKFKKESE